MRNDGLTTEPPLEEPVPPSPAASGFVAAVGVAEVRGPRAFAWLKRFAKLWGFALFCVFVVYFFREVALPFVFAALVAYLLAPVVDRLSRLHVGTWRVPRGLAVILVYINVLAALALFIGYFIPKLSSDFARLFREAPTLMGRVNQEYVPRAGAWVDRYLGAGTTPAVDVTPGGPVIPSPPRRQVIVEPLDDGRYRLDVTGLALEVRPGPGGRFLIAPPVVDELSDRVGEGRWERSIKKLIQEKVRTTEIESKRAIEYGQKFVRGVVTGIARLVLVLMVAAFILVDLERVRGFLRSLVPEPYRVDYDRIAKGIDRGLSGVIRGQLIICLCNGFATYLGLLIFHVKYALLLALVATVMSLVPIFGSILSSIPIVAVALVSSGTFDVAQGVYVLLWIILVHLVEANFLNPKIMGGAARIHPVLVVFALIAGEHSYGLVGALFAVPVASIIQTLFLYFRRHEGRSGHRTVEAPIGP